jgi:hypothetical protein
MLFSFTMFGAPLKAVMTIDAAQEPKNLGIELRIEGCKYKNLLE